MHFAAFAYVGESVVDPGKYYVDDVLCTFPCWKRCAAPASRPSCCPAPVPGYGIMEKLPISEDAPQVPIIPMGDRN